MSTLRIETLQNLAGTRTRGSCWAWVYFDGTVAGTPILASLNVSSVTDVGVGRYGINLTTPMPDLNYAVAATHGANDSAGANTGFQERNDVARTTSSFEVFAENNAGANVDVPRVSVIVFGN